MISVIMATFNESGNIEELIKRTARALEKENFEIIVIDDNSPDGTSKVVQKLQKGRPYLHLITRINERGLPSAIERGIKESKGEIVAWFDCDLSVAPEELKSMVPLIDQVDIVLGSRFIKGGSDVRGIGYSRDLSKLLNDLARIILSPKISDYTSGLIMAKKEALAGTVFDGVHGTYFVGMLYRALKRGIKIQEVPYVFSKRGYGESKIRGLRKYIKTGLIYLQALILARLR